MNPGKSTAPSQPTTEQAKSRLLGYFRGKKKAVDKKTLDGAHVIEKAVNTYGPSAAKRSVVAQAREKIRAVKVKVVEHRATSSVSTLPDAELVDSALLVEQLGEINKLLADRLMMLASLGKTLHSLARCEFIQETGHGGKVLSVAAHFNKIESTLESWKTKNTDLITMGASASDPGDADLKRALLVQFKTMIPIMGSLSADLEEAQGKAASAIEYEAIKAVVVSETSKYQDNQDGVEKAVIIVDQGMAGVNLFATHVADVPNEYAKGTAEITHAVLSVLTVLKSPIARFALSRAVERDMKKYESTEGSHKVYKDHTANPLLMAELLKRKRIADTQQILDMVATPIVDSIKDLTPTPSLVDAAWKAITTTIIRTVTRYQQERIDKARGALALAPIPSGVDPTTAFDQVEIFVDTFGESVLEGMKDELKENVFAVMDPIGLATAGLIVALAEKIASLIVAALPVNPAQTINGDQLFDYIESIANATRTYVQIKPIPVAHACPTHTADGVAVRLRLSEPEKMSAEAEADTDTRWLVTLAATTADGTVTDGEIGYVYLSDKRFEAGAGMLSEDIPPPRDYKGVRITEVFIKFRSTDKNDNLIYPAVAGTVKGAMKRLELEPGRYQWLFQINRDSPRTPTPASDWKNRIILRPGLPDQPSGGYEIKATKTTVSGTWYRPVSPTGPFLFIGSTGQWEWASEADACGNTPTAKVGEELDGHVAYDEDIELLLMTRPQ